MQSIQIVFYELLRIDLLLEFRHRFFLKEDQWRIVSKPHDVDATLLLHQQYLLFDLNVLLHAPQLDELNFRVDLKVSNFFI